MVSTLCCGCNNSVSNPGHGICFFTNFGMKSNFGLFLVTLCFLMESVARERFNLNLSEHRISFNTNLDLPSLRILFLYTFQLTSLYLFKDFSKLMSWCIFKFQGCSETPSNQAFEGAKLLQY